MSIPKKYLTEKVILIESRVDNISILRILTQNKQINKADPNYNYYKKLADWANSAQNKTGPIDLSTIKLSNDSLITTNKLAKNTNHLGHTLSQLKNLMDQQGKYDVNRAESNLIQKTTLEILAGLSGIKSTTTPAEEAPKEAPTEEHSELDDTTVSQGIDWTAEKAKRLADADGKSTAEILSKFYNDYYSIEYAGVASPEKDTNGIVSKLKSLDKILIPEFNALGYSPDVNPLAQFLKIVIALKLEKKSSIFDKLTTNTYGAIHNSFVNGQLKGNTLGNYDEKHLLFCDDLYNYRGTDMVKYLKLFNETLSQAEGKEEERNQSKWQLAAKIFIKQALPANTNTFTDKVNALLNIADVRLPTGPDAKLRSHNEIAELYTYIFKASPANEKQTENEAIKAVVSAVKSKKIILDMIYYITSDNAFKQAHAEYAATAEQRLSALNYTENSSRLANCRAILTLNKDELSIDDWLTIAKRLAKIYDNEEKKKAGK